MNKLFSLICFLLLITPFSHGFDVWQGFQHKWERRVLDIAATPHRLGSTANYIATVSSTSGTNQTVANITMTPGVNGDYAHPSTFYTSFATSPSSGVFYSEGEYLWSFVGNASYDPSQRATFSTNSVSALAQLQFPISGIPSAEMFLRGWRVDMSCDPSLQPQGHECNSNGVWPSELSVDLANCTVSSSQVSCVLDLAFSRYWTPLLGGGKPFNYVMSFDFYVYYAAVTAKTFSATRSYHVSRSDLHSRPAIETAQFIQGTPGYQNGIVAVTGFSFSFLETDNFHELGRYIEDMSFFVSDPSYDAASGLVAFNATVGIHAPITTMPSLIDYYLASSLLQFQTSLPNPTSSIATGSICVPDAATYFTCAFHHLTARTNVEIPLN